MAIVGVSALRFLYLLYHGLACQRCIFLDPSVRQRGSSSFARESVHLSALSLNWRVTPRWGGD